jgi:hypothetical protein
MMKSYLSVDTDKQYSYEIVAYDFANNELARSNEVLLIGGDYTAPAQLSGLAVESNGAGG